MVDTSGMRLRTGLWIDGSDAVQRIGRLLGAGDVTAEQAEGMRHFAEHGYLVIEPGISERDCRAVDAEIDALWRDRPANVAYASDGPARSMRHADPRHDRRRGYRIHDAHSHGATIRSLYLHPVIHRWMELLLGEEAAAIQSLYFEFGSEQILHRDPVVVPTRAEGHLFAAWIALEDIAPGSGALVYVPGSHRLPYFEFAPGEYRFDRSRMGEAEIVAGTAFDDEQGRLHGLEPRRFTARRGQVLLWHAGLRHGGSPITDPDATRRSLVVHFSTRRTYGERAITISEPGPDGDVPVVVATSTVIEEDGRRGFQNPMVGYTPLQGGA